MSSEITPPVPYQNDPTREGQTEGLYIDPKVKKAMALLGKDFLGVEAILQMGSKLKATGVDVEFNLNSVPPFPYSEIDLELAKENEEMLILRAGIMKIGRRPLAISLINFRELFNKDPKNEGSQVFYEGSGSRDWYTNESFAAGTIGSEPKWALVKKNILCDTASTDWVQQMQSIRGYGEMLHRKGGLQTQTKRRTAIEAVWDTMLNYITRGKSKSEEYDWTRTLASDGRFVYVGEYDSRGLEVNAYAPAYAAPYLGVQPSR